jgi:transcription antitermination factor NusG
MSLQWYVIQSKPNQEESLCAQLLAREVEVFYPKIRVKPVDPRARKIKAYFPGYLFVRIDLEHTGISFLQFTPFAKGLVLYDHEPAPVPETLIAAIRRRVDEVNAAGCETQPVFEHGETVSIHDGPFAGFTAIFDCSISGRERVKVLIEILSKRFLPVELDPSSLSTKTDS